MQLFINPKSDVNPDIPNLQLVYAATIESEKGKKVKIVDLNSWRADEERYLKEESSEFFISIRPFSEKKATEIAKKYKNKYSAAKIKSITGIIDVLCCYSFIQFQKKTSYENKKYSLLFSDNLPFPKYELLDSFHVFQRNWQTGKWNYPIMTSLGCPYQCVYCMSRNRKWQARSVKNCYEELEQAQKKYGFKYFALLDDCFNLDKKRVIDFCNLIRKLNVKWLCTNGLRADRFDEDTAKAMVKSGCIHIGFGAESYDQRILNNIRKGLTIKQLDDAVEIAKKYFKNIHVFFIIGLPGATYETDLKSLRWALQKGISAHFSYFVPFEKTYEGEAFYGNNARPIFSSYPKELQKRIYDLTAHMRADYSGGYLAAAIDRLKLIWMFDRTHVIKHIFNYLKNKVSF